MRFISKIALTITLSTALAIATSPLAFAQKKDDKAKGNAATAPAGPKLKLSKQFTAAYAAALDALIKKKDLVAAKAAFPAALAAATSEDDKYEAGIFAVNLGTQAKDVALQKQGIDLLIASPLTPQQNRGLYQFQRAAWSYDAKDYAASVVDLNKAYEMGYRNSQIELLIANSLGQTKRYPEAVVWMRKYFEAPKTPGQKVDATTYALAANFALKTKDEASANGFLKDLVRSSGKPEYWHDALTILMRSRNMQLAELLDIYRLMRRTDALMYEQEYAGYAESADARRYPAEVTEVIGEGMAKGIITKTNRNITDAQQTANSLLAEDRKTLANSEASAKASANGYQISLSADALFSNKEYARSKAMYELAISKGGLRDKDGADQTDRVNMRLAQSKIGLGDMAGAKIDLAKITGTNRKAIADYWMIFIEQKTAAKPAV